LLFRQVLCLQGGVILLLLANIALDGIEDIHPSVRYADDMIIFLKPKDNAERVLTKIKEFLAKRGMEISEEKTRITYSTNGFDFLGWNFRVQKNGKIRSIPSEDNFRDFRKKVKTVVNSSNYGAEVKVTKLAPIVRGWRNYHKNCDMSGTRESLWFQNEDARIRFIKEKKVNKHEAVKLVKKAFPKVPYEQFGHVMVTGTKSPYDGDTVYWSKRNSKLYDNTTSKTLNKQNHTCGYCGLKLLPGEDVQLHHVDGNHDNWKPNNLAAVHRSCHQLIHMGRPKGQNT
ncbi:MAG: RNA-dependent DNA polymerase, partial [Moorea sp. SIO3E2]|nr:RNA-dependent DNA polymerase [Moorena sp. SIO3E2]